MAEAFYRWFSERKLTGAGAARRRRIEEARLAMVTRYAKPPGDLLEVGPGHGSLARAAVAAGWRYRGIEASRVLADTLTSEGLDVKHAWTPPIPGADQSADVVYADQVLEHMSGIDAAREFVAEAHRILRPNGVFFVVVPDYLKERAFFWDIDYTHNFITTERRVRQLLYDGGFDIAQMVRSIGVATGLARDALAAGSVLANLPGLDPVSRYTGTEDFLFRVRKNLFETLAFVARKSAS